MWLFLKVLILKCLALKRGKREKRREGEPGSGPLNPLKPVQPAGIATMAACFCICASMIRSNRYKNPDP